MAHLIPGAGLLQVRTVGAKLSDGICPKLSSFPSKERPHQGTLALAAFGFRNTTPSVTGVGRRGRGSSGRSTVLGVGHDQHEVQEHKLSARKAWEVSLYKGQSRRKAH